MDIQLQRERIVNAVKGGYNFKAIKLRCGNPSGKVIAEIIKEVDPYMYSILNDTVALKRYRDKLYEKYLESEYNISTYKSETTGLTYRVKKDPIYD